MEQLERVGRVVHEVDAVAEGSYNETEEGAAAWRIEHLDAHGSDPNGRRTTLRNRLRRRPRDSYAVWLRQQGVVEAKWERTCLLDSLAMTYIVTETCVDLKDKSCIEVCPVDCIHEADEDRMVYIDPDECIDCGACVDPCPVDAIYAEEDVPDTQVAFVDINKVYFKDKALARSQLADVKPPPESA